MRSRRPVGHEGLGPDAVLLCELVGPAHQALPGAVAEEGDELARAQAAVLRPQLGDEQGPIDFDFSDFFGGRAQPRGPMRGGDLHASVEIDLRQAIEGTEMQADLPGHGSVRIRIPKGADTGSTLRVPGKGSPGRNGGPPGDLVIETIVRPHPVFRRDGLDLHVTLPVTLAEAYNGASVEVPTFDGPVVLKIPPRTQQHARLRLRGKGVARKDDRGDLFVEVDVRMPDRADAALSAALAAADTLYSRPVREGLVP